LTLDGRSDDKFSQKVRNLKSHDALRRKGFATFTNGRYKVTASGETIAHSGKAVMAALSEQLRGTIVAPWENREAYAFAPTNPSIACAVSAERAAPRPPCSRE
jgi:hypothetical protein